MEHWKYNLLVVIGENHCGSPKGDSQGLFCQNVYFVCWFKAHALGELSGLFLNPQHNSCSNPRQKYCSFHWRSPARSDAGGTTDSFQGSSMWDGDSSIAHHAGDRTAKEEHFIEKWDSWSAEKCHRPLLLSLCDCRMAHLGIPICWSLRTWWDVKWQMAPYFPLFQVDWTCVIYSSKNQQQNPGSHSCVSLGNLSAVDIASVAFV